MDFGGVDDADAEAPPDQGLGQRDAIGTGGLHANRRLGPVEAVHPSKEGREAFGVVVKFLVAIPALFVQMGGIELGFGDVYANGRLMSHEVCRNTFKINWDGNQIGTTRPVQPYCYSSSPGKPGAYAYRSNSMGECGRWGVQSAGQVRNLRDKRDFPTFLPMITRGF